MSARPFVQVQLTTGKVPKVVPLPTVFSAPIRLDVVSCVHRDMNKNRRQPYAVSSSAGEQTSAESWGTGRAVARIPRVPGGGTSRSGQGAFGNMCRGGRMYSPTKIWRRWHRKINLNQKRYALASALAASALPSLVLARGHRVENVAEVPLVVASENVKEVTKSSAASALLKKLNAFADVEKAKDSHKLRRGKGKMRNRRYVSRRGPLVVYSSQDNVTKGFRNLPGVELVNVERLNLLQLAPGGHLGRFVVWTESAFSKLDSIYGTNSRQSKKAHYKLPRSLLSNPDVTRIINSDEIQTKLRPARKQRRNFRLKKNPLKNFSALVRLNPYAKTLRRRQILAQEARKKKKQAILKARRKVTTKPKVDASKAKKGPAKTAPKKAKAKVSVQKTIRKSHAKFHKLLLSP